jgi:hypothetical protein
VKIVKPLRDAKDSAKFDALQSALKVARPMAARYLYVAEAVIDPALKFKLTAANINKARDRGLRWERIAAYTGSTVPEVQAMFVENGGDMSKSYTGRGKRPDGVPADGKPARKPTAKETKAAAAAAKRGPGRPKGSKNRPKPDVKVRRRSSLPTRP